MKARWYWLLLAIPVLAYLPTGVTVIYPEERAVVRRFGDVVARPGPGLWIGFPYGIDRVDRIPVLTARQLDVGFNPDFPEEPAGQYLTGDQNLVNVRVVVEYAIDDRDGELEHYVVHREQVDGVLARTTEALVGEWIAGRPVDEVLLAGRAALPRYLMERIAQRLGELHIGILVQRVSVDHLAAPAEVRDAFEAVTRAQTNILTRTHQAEQEANQRLREADATRFKLGQQALAYREEQVKAATAEAQSFLARWQQYQQLKSTNPDILAAIWWEEMSRTFLALKTRGRIDVLDPYLGPNGLDITQFLPPRRK